MNISANLGSAFVASGIKSNVRTPGRLTQQSSGGATNASDDVEFTSGSAQIAERAFGSDNVISSVGEAESEAGYLKSVILALPALVLRGQANVSSAVKANLQAN